MPFFALAAAGLVGSIGGAVISGNAAQSAAQTQADAANQASQVQNQQFQQTQANEQPFLQAGQNSLSGLMAGLNNGTFTPGLNPNIGALNTNALPGAANTPAAYQVQPFDFHASPGYQFALQQGLGAVTNRASATGGLQGGNTLKALTNYATGAANQDYQNQFADYISQNNLGLSAQNQNFSQTEQAQNQNFNQALAGQGQQFGQQLSLQQLMDSIGAQGFGQLQTVVGSGQNAAASLGALGANNAQSIGNNLMGAANATSAAQVAGANAATGAINNGVSNLTQLQLLKLLGGGGDLGGMVNGADYAGNATYAI